MLAVASLHQPLQRGVRYRARVWMCVYKCVCVHVLRCWGQEWLGPGPHIQVWATNVTAQSFLSFSAGLRVVELSGRKWSEVFGKPPVLLKRVRGLFCALLMLFRHWVPRSVALLWKVCAVVLVSNPYSHWIWIFFCVKHFMLLILRFPPFCLSFSWINVSLSDSFLQSYAKFWIRGGPFHLTA